MVYYPELRSVRRTFWRGIRSGESIEDAAAVAGVSKSCGWGWFGKAGGMPDVDLDVDDGARGRYLCLREREDIAIWRAEGESIRQIAARLGRWPSTVSRELARHSGRDGYRPVRAQKRAEQRARRPKSAKLAVNTRLCEEVQSRLDNEQHSPAQIANRLRDDFPDDESMRVSPETIYQSLYIQGRGALRRDLHQQLRTGRAVRKPRRRPEQRRGRIPNQVNIADRPPEADDRKVPGHWEGDLILGKNGASAIGTVVERTTGFVLLLHLPHDHTAEAVQEAIVAKMAGLPMILRQTLTWDQGRELTNHVAIAQAADLDIYFCDPHSPWQRGSNENTNGLLRQYFPKGTDLSVFTADYLDYVAMKLNNRPRKRHNWKTPAEELDQILSKSSNPPGVAPTG